MSDEVIAEVVIQKIVASLKDVVYYDEPTLSHSHDWTLHKAYWLVWVYKGVDCTIGGEVKVVTSVQDGLLKVRCVAIHGDQEIHRTEWVCQANLSEFQNRLLVKVADIVKKYLSDISDLCGGMNLLPRRRAYRLQPG